ncbi:MAG: exodeoxyribonuclease V subunit beta [Vibrio sp.]
MAQLLNSMTFPLHGARLIEASAGTGKTFTIAALYLRLLLGHGADGSAPKRVLKVEEILVVTFTEAATAELRGRIRQRIHEARIAFARNETSDPVLKPLLEDCQNRNHAIEILLQAERQMDEAAIYTIHGFCQRMLTQNAFESGSRFQNEFIVDESQLKRQVVCDYWRKAFYPMPIEVVGLIKQYWGSPESLLSNIGNYLSGAEIEIRIANDPKSDIVKAYHDHLDRVDQVKKLWNQHCGDFFDLISKSAINKRVYNKNRLSEDPKGWLGQVNAWAADSTRDGKLCDNLYRFSQAELENQTNTDKGSVAEHEVFKAIENLIENQPDFKVLMMYQAIKECRQLFAKAKQRQAQLGFDDLLSQLDKAISNDADGLLAERIRTLYPVAMIDEFQDTDPQQYHIFSQIYVGQPDNGLFMIGDPKQAIYAFRGADIFTYIAARNQVTDHYTLGTNWRSSKAVIDGVNGLFEFDSSPFLYDKDIPFEPVQASPNAENMYWEMNGEAQPAMGFWFLNQDEPELAAAEEYRQGMAANTANQIHQILTASNQDQAHFVDKKGNSHAIQPSDIAVLVRTGREGKLIKDALAKQGIASVYLSNRDSVFDSVVAQDVLRLLIAASNPSDEGAMRAILASDLFDLNVQQIDQFNHDENAWENLVNEFETYHQLWTQRGVQPMLRAVLNQRHIAERWLSQLNGERQLTDLLHLSELIQQASLSLEGESALIRWLATNIEQHDGELADQTQRLESERKLVQIVTIHKSKGLEYDLVFLPFASSFRASSEAKFYDESSQQTVLDLSNDEESQKLAEKERLAEDLRLLYVAVTRAVYGCIIGIAPLKKGKVSSAHSSAIGAILQHREEGDENALLDACSKLVKKVDSIEFMPKPQKPSERFQPQEETLTLAAKTLSAKIDRNWRMTSYSGLVKQSTHSHAHNDHQFDAAVDVDKPIDSDAADVNMDALLEDLQETHEHDPWSMFEFPRGARPGTFLHTIFEEIDFTLPTTSPETEAELTRLLEKEQYDLQWLPAIQSMITQVLNTPLDGKELRLAEKGESQRLVEMEFLLPIESLIASQFNCLVQSHDQLSQLASGLDFLPVKGMLKGFIDLVFEHEGKYYVLDWKSNHLGHSQPDYHPDNLAQAMLDHRYDFQYQIYSLALHRFLKSRIADYSYDTHFGGVYYLFLRGFTENKVMDDDTRYGVFEAKPSKEFLQQFDLMLDAQKENAKAEPMLKGKSA